MKVNKKQAALMIGRARMTLYRDIEEKKISVLDDGKIDVSELQRVYGHENVKPLEEVTVARSGQIKLVEKKSHGQDVTVDTAPLKEEVARLNRELEKAAEERRREREQFTDQIDHLKETLKHSQEQNQNLTHLLTDERSTKAKEKEEKEAATANALATILETVNELKKPPEKKGFWQRLIGS